MPTKVLVLGFDACEASLLERWAAAGLLPGFAELSRGSRILRLSNCLETLPGAIWPELVTGVSCAKAARFFCLEQLRTGESRLRPLEPAEYDPERNYWTVASRQGRRVAVIDQVHTALAPNLNGVQLLEWGLHDRVLGSASDPPEFLADIHRRFGHYPVSRCDDHGNSNRGYTELLRGLERGIDLKTRFCAELLTGSRWDLFAATFSEAHCVGHQFWHFQDPSHPRYTPEGSARFGPSIERIYAVLDQALRHLISAAGPEARLFVLASHGMGGKDVGPYLLPELLVRLGLSASGGVDRGRCLRRVLDAGHFLPLAVKNALKVLARTTPMGPALARAGLAVDPFDSPRTRAAVVPNNRCGAIRINLRGREPQGSVGSGEEALALINLLRKEVLALRHAESGVPIVKRVATPEEIFGPGYHPDLPDLIVEFHSGLGRLDRCVSPTVGRIQAPIFLLDRYPRTGDHTPESRLWIAGPGVVQGRDEAHALDLAPSILQALHVPLPSWIDGRPVALDRGG
jgi:predicted AlkP superfamily phosphohydrolase/phosphomutase